MKYLLAAIFLLAAAVGDLVIADEPVNDGEIGDKHSEVLYVHFFYRTRPYSGPPPKGGGPRPDLPPSSFLSFRVEPDESFEVILHPWCRYCGRIRREKESFQAVLDCIYVPAIHFEGEVILDQIFTPQSNEDLKPTADTMRVAFSHSKDVKPFLKLQAKIDAGEATDHRVTQPSNRRSNDQSDLPATVAKPPRNSDQSETLYLHYFRPVNKQRDNQLNNLGHRYPPQRLLTLKIQPGKTAELIDWCSSRVSRQGAGYLVEIKGAYRFSGQVDLGEVFDLELAPGYDNTFPIKLSYCAVLSNSNDIKPFLEAAEIKSDSIGEKAPVESDDR